MLVGGAEALDQLKDNCPPRASDDPGTDTALIARVVRQVIERMIEPPGDRVARLESRVFSLERARAAERAERERARIETDRRIATLERACGLGEEATDQMDHIFSWAQTHPDDTRRLRDHFVAVSLANDLVDHDVSFEQLYARVLHRKDVVVGRLTFDGASEIADPA